jgi:hypothetical protein
MPKAHICGRPCCNVQSHHSAGWERYQPYGEAKAGCTKRYVAYMPFSIRQDPTVTPPLRIMARPGTKVRSRRSDDEHKNNVEWLTFLDDSK